MALPHLVRRISWKLQLGHLLDFLKVQRVVQGSQLLNDLKNSFVHGWESCIKDVKFSEKCNMCQYLIFNWNFNVIYVTMDTKYCTW
jgi:hypothetical protein